ncbi:MAG: DUF4059 family protein [Enterococcus sp.]|nr:DUF4059 family protein [Enterococcus sp.]
MFFQMVQFYGFGLILSTLVVFIISGIWLLYRMRRKLDKTAKERQAFLYDMILIAVITIPILAFAFSTLLIMISA